MEATAPEEVSRAAFDAYVDAFWSRGDTTALARGLAPTMTYTYNGRASQADHQRHLRSLRSFRTLFPDLTAVTDVFTARGEYGAAATTWTGTYQGPSCGNKSAGRKVSWTVNYIFRVAEGRIVELWETWDEAGLFLDLEVPRAGKCDA